jgi:hypothetical protein
VLRATVATAPAIEPVVANRDNACETTAAGLGDLDAAAPLLQSGLLSAATQRTGGIGRSDLQQNFAGAALADLRVGSLGSLGLALPLDQVPLPAELQTVDVDISAVTGPVNALPDPLNLTPTLPEQLTLDISAAVRELVKLPSADVFGVRAASALAGASCVAGRPVTAAQRSVSGVTVLGNEIDVDTFGDQPVVDTQNIDLSQLDTSLVKLPVIEGLLPALRPAVDALVANALAATKALPPVALPVDLLRVSVTPGIQTRTADSLTQTALEVKISALGTPVADLVLGEAKVGTAGVDCAAPARAATPPPVAATAAQEALACTTRRLVLTDVLRRGSRVKITGVADKRFAGRFVTIRFEADGSTAGRALVSPDGTFKTTAALPSQRLRSSNRGALPGGARPREVAQPQAGAPDVRRAPHVACGRGHDPRPGDPPAGAAGGDDHADAARLVPPQ